MPLAAAAPATQQIGLGTAIALAFVRSPFATALSALDLDELSGGRLRFGVGTGVRRLVEDWHGQPFDRPTARLREWIEVFRAVVERAHVGEPIEAGGQLVTTGVVGWQRPYPPPRPSMPVFVASVGPRLTELAGEVADGWISHELTSVQALETFVVPRLEAGLSRAGRRRSDLEVVVSGCCVIDEDRAAAEHLAAHTVAFYGSVRTYEPFFEAHGFGDEARRIQQAFGDQDTAAMVAAVSPEMVRAFTFAGTVDDVRKRLAGFDGLADAVKLSPPTYFVPPDATRAAQQSTLEMLA